MRSTPTLVLLLLAIPTAAPAQQGATPPPAATPTPLAATGLEMVLPKDLEPEDGSAYGLLFFAAAEAVDGFRDNINLAAGPAQAPDPKSDRTLRDAMLAQYAKLLKSYAFVDDGRMQVLGESAYWLSGTFDQNGVPVRNLQILVPGTPCQWLTLTARQATFEQRDADLKQALATLRRVGDGAAAATTPKLMQQGKRTVCEELGFSLELPAGYALRDPMMGAFLCAGANEVDGFAPNCNVRSEAAADAFDPKDLRAALAETMPKSVDAYELLECTTRAVGDRKAVRVRATCRQGGKELTLLQFFVPGRPKSFVVTFTLPTATATKAIAALDAAAATIRVAAPKPADAPPKPRK